MPSNKLPFDPDPQRGDAFGELARQGYQAMRDVDHATRLARLAAKTRGEDFDDTPVSQPIGKQPSPESKLFSRRRQPWLAAAAAILILITVALLWYLQSGVDNAQQPIAARPPNDATAEQAPTVSIDEEAAQVEAVLKSNRRLMDGEAPLSQQSSEFESSAEKGDQNQYSRVSRDAETPESRSRAQQKQTAAQSTKADFANPPDREQSAQRTESKVYRKPSPRAEAEGVNSTVPSQESSGAPLKSVWADRNYVLENGPMGVVLNLKGQVVDLSLLPLEDAEIFVEETGQTIKVQPNGEFDLAYLSTHQVAFATAPGFDTLYFSLGQEREVDIQLARSRSGALSSIRSATTSRELPQLLPRAQVNGEFERYREKTASTSPGLLPSKALELQFRINRDGRPINILAGPTFSGQAADLEAAKQLLLSGPSWPESYRRRSWRYTVLPKQ